ncbi:hypothetical protein NSPZN2_40098 [Nitrospira defluvii]|uniref:Uncharacterized protein n=1 Tax=Nitrospira defluvii TaxID=330214 RepID=A0ABM8RR09_9BACT|nr:hypothetical protein NSPZN2_40098 [Nitrospira defluvii]
MPPSSDAQEKALRAVPKFEDENGES